VTGPRPGFVFFFAIVAAALFGGQIYPYISPAYGGGAATLARVDLQPGSVPADLEAALSRPVAIIDRDDHLLDMAVCADSGALAITPVSLPSEIVRVVTLSGLVAMPEAARRLCAMGPTIPHTTQLPDWCQRLPRPQYAQLHRVPSADPWFEVYAVTPDVFAIYEPHQAEEAISYLILGHKRAALFDTGLGIGDIKKVVTALTSLPIVVLNSHTHDDHVGDNWEFTEILGMDTQFTRTNARGSVADAQGELAQGSICGQLPSGFDPKAYTTRPWRITRWIHDGDTVDLGGRVLRVLATPGHTPDSISLLDEANGLLWTGDSFYPGTIWLKRPETDLDAYERSMARIAALVPRLHLVLGSHNAPVAEPSILTKLAADVRAVRSGRVRSKPAEDGNVTYDAGDGIMFLMHPR
jgi:glyoxylase-like metal-dependent hydrolase (beta-lactamase superfamily II)